ncbi:hypothetical protein BH24ACT14_BH24ACT14_02270 [soil metagenome]
MTTQEQSISRARVRGAAGTFRVPLGPEEFRDTIFGKVEIYASARKHGVRDADIEHAVEHALVAAEEDDGKVLYLGPDRAANLLEVVSVLRDNGTEIVIHAMRMRRTYESLLHDMGDPDG